MVNTIVKRLALIDRAKYHLLALASVIGFIELTKAGTMIANATFQPMLVYGCVALMYFVLCFPVSLWARMLERKLHAAH